MAFAPRGVEDGKRPTDTGEAEVGELFELAPGFFDQVETGEAGVGAVGNECALAAGKP
jgi:hypothetical protein